MPVANLTRNDLTTSHECVAYNHKILEHLKQENSPSIIILHGRWSSYVEGESFDNKEGGIEKKGAFTIGIADGSYSELTAKERVITAYKDHIQKLLNMGKKVVIIYPVPEAGWNVPDYTAAQTLRLGYIPEISTSYDVFKKRNHDTFAALDSIEHQNLYRFYPHKYLCSEENGRCMNANKDAIYYTDDDHLSLTGARLFADDLAAIIKSIPTTDYQLSTRN